jgi:hypothetical protein
MFSYLLNFIIGFILLYVAGWDLIWGESIYSNKDLLIQSSKFAIRFNDLYYGGVILNRFFESTVISWISLSISISLLTPFRLFFFLGK